MTFEDLIQYLKTIIISEDKFSNGTYLLGEMKNDKHRKDENLINRHALVIDIDDLNSDTNLVEDIKGRFNFSFILYSTHSHTKTNPRYRLIIPLSKPIEREYYTPALKLFENQLGIKFDSNAFDWSRCMARTTLKSLESEFIFEYQDTYYLDTEKLVAGLEKQDISKQKIEYKFNSEKWQFVQGGMKDGDGRNTACTSLVGLLLRRYVPLEVTIQLIQHWNNSNIDPLSDKELATIFKSVIKIETARRGEGVT
ncbi:primase C-terminal domain-containing protein [Macrococcoides bohemicum]|uniref:primase C-terminal domain-containing protein n=1 Tax=Macrococcoides bohemicum TaxID=1903056 RepID=UPI001C5D453A|nr:primase C-terminal domain-containing protein [Macrococcus bohemicus]QYA45457.1 primase C-terminal domain-containing protein [Macrococcus bohemicus]